MQEQKTVANPPDDIHSAAALPARPTEPETTRQDVELSPREKLIIAAVAAEFKGLITDLAETLPALIARGVQSYIVGQEKFFEQRRTEFAERNKPRWETPDE